MTNVTADLVAEALELIERGDFSLEAGTSRYGQEWPAMRPAIETALQVSQASQPPIVSARPFVALDKTAGWAALQSQLSTVRPTTAPQVAVRPTPAPTVSWQTRLARLFSPSVRRVGAMALMTLVLFVGLTFAIGDSLPGDWLYRAKLGWDHIGELTSFSVNDKAQASLTYADHRLAELESLAASGRPEQLNEVQGQYLRGLQLSIYYAADTKFTSYAQVYSLLSDQRDRVYRLQSYSFMTGQRPLQVSNLLDNINNGVYIISSKVPGVPAQP